MIYPKAVNICGAFSVRGFYGTYVFLPDLWIEWVERGCRFRTLVPWNSPFPLLSVSDTPPSLQELLDAPVKR